MTDVEPLSNKDICSKLAKYKIDVTFIPYNLVKHIESLLDYDPFILLYQLHYPVGHWTCIFLNDEGINYFDPTGTVPDELLKTNFDHIAGRQKMGADYTYLNKLLLETMQETGLELIYNEKPLQMDGTNTCGHHVFMRLMFKDLPNDDYNKVLCQYGAMERERKVVKFWESK